MRFSPHPLLLPLLITFSLTGAGLIVYYLYERKRIDDEIDRVDNRTTSEIEIPRNAVPIIIGRGGTTIEKLKSETNTIIGFKEVTDVNQSHRTCVIIGTPESIELAEKKIQFILEDQAVIEVSEIWIPKIILLILTANDNDLLNEIQHSTKAKIIFNVDKITHDLEKKQRIIIKGTKEQIECAQLRIEQIVLKKPYSIPRVEASSNSSLHSKEDEDYSNDFDNVDQQGFFKVFVSAVDSPDKFYIQVIGSTNEQLDDLIQEMTDFYNDEQNHEFYKLSDIYSGRKVAAKFLDNKWYRAEVVNNEGDGTYDVFFLDFGDRKKVDEKDMFELRTDFLSLRQQAREFSLAHVLPNGYHWKEDATLKFADLCEYGNWKPRLAKIVSYKKRELPFVKNSFQKSTVPCVELAIPMPDGSLVSINSELVKENLAVWDPSSKQSMNLSNGNTHTKQDLNEPTGNIEEQSSISNGNSNSSRDFIENESSPSNYSGYSNNYKNSSSKPMKKIKNPFKKHTEVKEVVFMPAGAEDEFDDDDDYDGFD